MCPLVSLLFVGSLVAGATFYDTTNFGDEIFPTPSRPLPFPTCYAIDIDCLRRGLRTFFFMMDAQHLGMKPIDPALVSSIAVSFPEQQLEFRMRNINVTGAKWTKLVERRFNLPGGKSGIIFSNDLHITADILMNMAGGVEPHWAKITMDIQNAESNITYPWRGQRGIDREDYIQIGQERIAVRNSRTPTYFLQPDTEDAILINDILQLKPAVLDHLGNEITASVMHTIVDNFRLFANKIPVKFYYKYTA